MPKYAVLPVHESKHEIDKLCIQTNSNGKAVALKYQVQLQHKTLLNLADFYTFSNIHQI